MFWLLWTVTRMAWHTYYKFSFLSYHYWQTQITFLALALPEMIISNNGTCFCSQEFQIFVKQNGNQHVRTVACHPSSNGLAERYVKIMKDGLKKITLGSVVSCIWLASTDCSHVIEWQHRNVSCGTTVWKETEYQNGSASTWSREQSKTATC